MFSSPSCTSRPDRVRGARGASPTCRQRRRLRLRLDIVRRWIFSYNGWKRLLLGRKKDRL
eukprot:1589757-Pyramimonas_sp.AAC.1